MKYVAFLRAINVGGHLVKMGHLKSLFEELGFKNVETFIASGNVIFDTRTTNVKSLEAKIEKHLKKSLGYEVSTFLRSIDDLVRISEYQPFEENELTEESNTLFVCFLPDQPTREATKNLLSKSTTIDGFHVAEREVYWLYRRNHGESKFYGPPLEKCLALPTTVRNVNTVRRLVKKYS